ncbi:hypothetical protein K439DRAFT_1665100 [Ramaria rubella]|nr:hypothetical protein K439DRAFT_1665100 [Ramaria rubella]
MHPIASGVLALAYAWTAGAQATTTAVCTLLPWTTDALGNSPCLVAAALQGACNSGKWNIPSLTNGEQYSGPLQGQSNKCQCSTVVFSVISACGACQGGTVATWSEWMANCSASDISISAFPEPIPPGISIPAWAFLNITNNGTWDPSAAESISNAHAPDISSPSTSSSVKKPSHTGAIAGGVVGGLLALILVVAAATAIFLRRRQKMRPGPGEPLREKTDVERHPSIRYSVTPGALPIQDPPKLYDPSDPSTFPTSLTSSDPMYAGHTSPTPSMPYSYSSGTFSACGEGGTVVSGTTFAPPTTFSHPSGYKGVPEV